jgi:hypothetical protein
MTLSTPYRDETPQEQRLKDFIVHHLKVVSRNSSRTCVLETKKNSKNAKKNRKKSLLKSIKFAKQFSEDIVVLRSMISINI